MTAIAQDAVSPPLAFPPVGAADWGPRSAGRNHDATSPTKPITARTTIASAYERSGSEVRPATRIVPAIAVPREEPRLDTQRDSPEISPCIPSGRGCRRSSTEPFQRARSGCEWI